MADTRRQEDMERSACALVEAGKMSCFFCAP
jgi:hypothetical protein